MAKKQQEGDDLHNLIFPKGQQVPAATRKMLSLTSIFMKDVQVTAPRTTHWDARECMPSKL
jgi:hypothetical protein